MAIIQYSVRLTNAAATTTTYIGSFTRLAYVVSAGKIGTLELELPAWFDAGLLQLDGRLSVWRSINGRPPVQDAEAAFLIRSWHYTENTTTITAQHANELLTRRIINYYAGSSYSNKATPTAADDLIKVFVRENMGASVSTANRIGDDTGADLVTAGYLAIDGDVSAGPLIGKAAAWQNLYDVVTEICDAATENGTYLTCEIVDTGAVALTFRTYTGQRGIDHTADSGAPVILASDRWSLQEPQLVIDQASEVTFVTAGGQGERDLRTTGSYLDTARATQSPYNRREAFTENTQTGDTTVLDDLAAGTVRGGRARQTFTGAIVDTDAVIRGIHYDYGDLVTASFRGQQMDVHVDVISVTVDASGVKEEIHLRYDQPPV